MQVLSDAASSIVKTALLGRLAVDEDVLCQSQSSPSSSSFLADTSKIE